MPSRRHTVRTVASAAALSLAAVGLIAPAASALPAPNTTAIQVFTINDFHGRISQDLAGSPASAGIASIATAIREAKIANPNTLFVSSGDNIGASTFTSFIQQDTPTINTLRDSGLDVSAVGNHEFDAGFSDLINRVQPLYGGPEFTLGANVYERGTTTPALAEYSIQAVDGVNVAFIGVVTPETPALVTPTGVATIEFGNMLTAANRVADELTATNAADVIVLLVHDGLATTSCDELNSANTDFTSLVRGASPEISAIVSAHTHQFYSCTAPVGTTGVERPVIQAASYGNALGKLDILVDSTTKDLVSIAGSVSPLVVNGAATFAGDETIKATVAEAEAAAKTLGSVKAGTITADILRGGNPAGNDRGVESTLGNLVADVYLWATSNPSYAGVPAQISLMNPGGLRKDLLFGADGTVTYQAVAEVQPFANTLVTVTLTGAQLKSILEEQWQPDGSSRPKLQLGVSDGFSYTYDQGLDRGARILTMTYQGKAVAATDTFTVVTNSFLAAGGDNFVTFAQGTNRTDTGQIDLAATVAYFEAHPNTAPAPLNRAMYTPIIVESPTPTPSETSPTPTPQPSNTDGTPTPGPSNTPDGGTSGAGNGGKHPTTGAEAPLGIAFLGALLLTLGGLAFVVRRRSATHS